MKNLKDFRGLNESYFINIDDIDTILDKISEYGIESLNDIDKKQLEMFNTEDEKVISIIDKIANTMQEFVLLNNKIKDLVENDDEPGGKKLYINEWLPLNNQMGKLEAQIKEWGIELGDPRLTTMLKDIKPSLFFSDDGMDESMLENIKSYESFRPIYEGTWAYTRKDTEEMINALNDIKNPNEINDEFYKIWWNKVGDDLLYDELDKAKKEPQNWQSYVMAAVERLKWLLENVKDDNPTQDNNGQ